MALNDLDRHAALYRRIAREAPPAALDARILGAAARETTRRRAMAALALAACLLLTLGGLALHRPKTAASDMRPAASLAVAPESLGDAQQSALLEIDAAPPRSAQEEALLRIPVQSRH